MKNHFIVQSVIIRQLRNVTSLFIRNVHIGIKLQCSKFEYQATQKSSLVTHHKSVHMGLEYQCPDCHYQATQKGNLVTHQKSVHMVNKFHCQDCDYQATQ